MSRPGLLERQLPGDSSKQLLHVLGRLGRRLKEEQAGLLGVRLGVGRLDRPLVRLLGHEIQLVARQRDDDVLVGLPLEFLDPGFGFVE